MNSVFKAAAAIAALALGASLSSAAPSAPKGPQRSDRAQTEAERPDPNERICVRTDVTGSHLLRRICQSRRQWELDGGVPTPDD